MNKKAKLAILVLSIVLIVSVVGVSFAVWDNKTAQTGQLSVSVGAGVEVDAKMVSQEDNSTKLFAPVGTNDITKATIAMKLGVFSLATKAGSTTGIVGVDVKPAIKIVTNETTPVDLEAYIDVFIVSKDNYNVYTNTTNTVTSAVADGKLAHNTTGIEYGVIVIWKGTHIDNKPTAALVQKVAKKGIVVSIEFNAVEV